MRFLKNYGASGDGSARAWRPRAAPRRAAAEGVPMIRNLLWAAPFALVIFTLAILALAAAVLMGAAPAPVGYAGLGAVAALGALGFLAIRTGQRRARQGEGAA